MNTSVSLGASLFETERQRIHCLMTRLQPEAPSRVWHGISGRYLFDSLDGVSVSISATFLDPLDLE